MNITVWLNLDYTAALYIAAQVVLAGGDADDLDPIAAWLSRNERPGRWGYIDWPFELMKDLGNRTRCYCGEPSQIGRLCWECSDDMDRDADAT